MTTATDNNVQNGTSVPLSNIAPAEEKQGFFDRNLNRLVGFIAKATGQPDPKTWAPANTPPAAQNNIPTPQEVPNTAPIQENITAPGEMPAPQTPIINEPLPTPTPTPETSAPVEEKSFFQKLIANTQNLLNKTSEISSTIVNKTQNIAGSISNTTQNMANKVVEKTTAVSSTITNAPNMIAGQANTLIDKGIAMGGQLKDSVQNNAQNLTSNPLGAVQDIGSQIGQGAKNIWNQVVQGTQNLWAQAIQQGQNLATNPLWTVQNIGQQAIQQGQNFANNPINSMQNVGAQVVDQWKNLITPSQLPEQTADTQVTAPDTGNPANTISTEGDASGEEATISLPEANPVQQTVSETPESETPSSALPTSLPTADPTPIITNQDAPTPQAPVQEEAKTGVSSENIFSSLQQGASKLLQKTKEIWSSSLTNTKEFLQNPVTKIDQIAGAGGQTPEQLPPNNENTETVQK